MTSLQTYCIKPNTFVWQDTKLFPSISKNHGHSGKLLFTCQTKYVPIYIVSQCMLVREIIVTRTYTCNELLRCFQFLWFGIHQGRTCILHCPLCSCMYFSSNSHKLHCSYIVPLDILKVFEKILFHHKPWKDSNSKFETWHNVKMQLGIHLSLCDGRWFTLEAILQGSSAFVHLYASQMGDCHLGGLAHWRGVTRVRTSHSRGGSPGGTACHWGVSI